MKKFYFILCLLFFMQNKIFAQQRVNLPLFKKNYLQVDPFFFDYEIVSASKNEFNANNKQFISTRPSILFYLNIDDYIFRPFFSLNPTLSGSEGSFSVGKLFSQVFDLGLYTLLNHTENTVGGGSSQNGLIQSKFLIGPYFTFYPYADNEKLISISSRIAYEYEQYKIISSGQSTSVSNQKGININIGLQYSIQLSEKIYFSPNSNFTYFVTSDVGGDNTIRKGYEWQILPLSVQIQL